MVSYFEFWVLRVLITYHTECACGLWKNLNIPEMLDRSVYIWCHLQCEIWCFEAYDYFIKILNSYQGKLYRGYFGTYDYFIKILNSYQGQTTKMPEVKDLHHKHSNRKWIICLFCKMMSTVDRILSLYIYTCNFVWLMRFLT